MRFSDNGAVSLLSGGTGLISVPAGALLVGPSAGYGTFATLAIGAANTVLQSNGTAPQWNATLTIKSIIFTNTASGSDTGPSTWAVSNVLTFVGGTSGFAWKNQANNTTLMTLSNTGVLTVNGIGTHAFSANSDAANSVSVSNASSGSSALAGFQATNDASLSAVLRSYGSGASTSGFVAANASVLFSDSTVGLRLANSTSSGPIDIFTNNGVAIAVRGRFHPSGGFSWGDLTDPGGTNIRVAGKSTLGSAATAGSMPTGLNVHAVYASGSTTDIIGHLFGITSSQNQTGGPQALEGFTYMSQSGTTTLAIATIGNVQHAGTGTTTKARAVQGGIIITNSGGGTDAVMFFAAPSGRTGGGTGTYTHGYGLYVDTFGTGFTNKWGVYIVDANASNYFAGTVGIGMTTTHALELSTDDAVKPTSNTWTIASDRRLKRRIRPFADGLAAVLQLAPVTYELNGRGGTPRGAAGIGLVAQDAQAIAPYLVRPLSRERDAYLGLDASPLPFMLINAVRELHDRLAALERRAAA